jgi:hypothetical protein
MQRCLVGVGVNAVTGLGSDRILTEYAANFCENKAAPARKLGIDPELGADELLGLSLGHLTRRSSVNRQWW